MTIKELIEHLQSFPQDAIAACVIQMCSDYSILAAEDVKYHPAGTTIGDPPWVKSRRYVLRNGQIMEYDEKTWDPSEKPVFVPVVAFPGN